MKITVIFLDGEVLKGETFSMPVKTDTVFWITLPDNQRIAIPLGAVKKIEVMEK